MPNLPHGHESQPLPENSTGDTPEQAGTNPLQPTLLPPTEVMSSAKEPFSEKALRVLQKAGAFFHYILINDGAENPLRVKETIKEVEKPHQPETVKPREQWTHLSFRSSSAEEADPGHGHDRVLDDAEHGIWGVFDGVSSAKGAAEAAEITKRIFHETLLGAAKPTSLEQAKQLMELAFARARTEFRRLDRDEDFEGSTTANVSFAVEIDGQDYLIIGNAGDSVCYKTDEMEGAKLLTTEQSNAMHGKAYSIFNSVGPYPLWTEADIRRLPDDRRVPNHYYFDEIIAVPIKPGDRFVHATDGISGDEDAERLSAQEFAEGLQKNTPQQSVGWLFAISRKDDDKAAVAVHIGR